MKTGIRFFLLLLAAATVLASCKTTEEVAPQISSTGIYTMESSGYSAKEYRFSASTIRNVKLLSTLKEKKEENGTEQEMIRKELAFDLIDDNGGEWSGTGFTIRDEVSEADGGRLRFRLIHEMLMTEKDSGRIIKIRNEFDSDDSDGYMKGGAADGEGKALAAIYSSRNLKGSADPAEDLNGYSIHRGKNTYAAINRTKYAWILSFNLPEDEPRRIDLAAVMSALFVLTEEGK
jgi:predicted small secreted protein